MLHFKNFNINPKNRKTGDCSTRAIAYALGITWEEALKLQYEEALKSKYDITSRQVMEKVLNKFGYIKMRQPKTPENFKYTIYSMDKVLSKNQRSTKVVCNVANHYVVIDGDNYVDTWNSGCKCCGNYYIKQNCN